MVIIPVTMNLLFGPKVTRILHLLYPSPKGAAFLGGRWLGHFSRPSIREIWQASNLGGAAGNDHISQTGSSENHGLKHTFHPFPSHPMDFWYIYLYMNGCFQKKWQNMVNVRRQQVYYTWMLWVWWAYVTLPETNSSHLKMVVSNWNLLCHRSIFTGYVSFREGSSQ